MAKHAKHAADPTETHVADDAAFSPSFDGDGNSVGSGDAPAYDVAGNNAPEAFSGISVHQRKSRRTRIVLIVASAVLVALLAALAYFAVQLFNEARDVATQSVAKSDAEADDSVASDARGDASSRLAAPDLVGLLGRTQDEAVASLGRGATVASSSDITEETGEGEEKKEEVVGKSVTVTLADEASDARGNTPTVYLTLDKDGAISEAGYSASVGALGYGDVSFSAAVQQEHLVERLLTEVGIPTQDGAVELPAAEQYRTYADDGTTISQEQYTFSGQGAAADGSVHAWTCRLNYDYSAANVSNNLADTLRLVYVYVSK